LSRDSKVEPYYKALPFKNTIHSKADLKERLEKLWRILQMSANTLYNFTTYRLTAQRGIRSMNPEEKLRLIETRHCTRSFQPNIAVPAPLLNRIFEVARNAPSSQNNQPWSCYVLQGQALTTLSTELLAADDTQRRPDYVNRPTTLTPLQQDGINNYFTWWFEKVNHIELSNVAARNNLSKRNLHFWDAPVHVIVTIPKDSAQGTFLDVGCFVQNILLACHAVGLGALPQYSIAAYAPVVKKVLGLKEDCIVVCGISMGYASDSHDEERQKGPPRLPVEGFVQFLN
jgi:nitroreductase